MSSRQLKELYYKSHSRFCKWVKDFNKYGIEGLKNKLKSGRKSRLTEEQKKEIKEIVENNKPYDFGYNTATWNGIILMDLIKKDMV